ncbi:hydantoinase/oxoprolinase [Azospirillum palustre]|uniref:Hydantoinase/oxoprolinase n=1 Tax=Azospirillum palustre TaxID=2044885 RepID=A0A2B8BCW1_9PROT|nr:hydantoinase/oxoprolinase family protein [Azospirillum palustre]PGH55755.1 hydantoinase/oxoprolinase [Azospirillum palustre]
MSDTRGTVPNGTAVIGWDIGGAHLKAAWAEDGRLRDAVQVPCRLWQGLGELDTALTTILDRLPAGADHVVTMTGELVDLFDDRTQGVHTLIDRIAAAVPPGRLLVYAGRRGLLSPQEARGQVMDVASANWMATAAVVAKRLPAALLVDMGSTTTDIVPVLDGEVAARGVTDHDRMAVEELLYTGLTRTAVMAMERTALVAGERLPMMAEYFATSADLYRVLGRLDEAADQHPAADNGQKTVEASLRRLARMVGHDAGDYDPAVWRAMAGDLVERQMRRIHDGASRVLSAGAPPLPSDAPVVGAGVGRAVVREVAARLGRPYLDFCDVVGAPGQGWVASCAPAAAMALLG